MRHTSLPSISHIRKLHIQQETVFLDGGLPLERPVRSAAVAAVISNPWLGNRPDMPLSPDMSDFMPGIAVTVVQKLLAALGGPEEIEAFGKAAIVGEHGELEHAAAVIHTPYFGNTLRDGAEGTSIICFSDTRGGAGTTISVPIWHKTLPATRSHYQSFAVRIPDAPRPDEIVLIAAASTGSRPHPRIGDRTTDPTAEVVREVAARFLEPQVSLT